MMPVSALFFDVFINNLCQSDIMVVCVCVSCIEIVPKNTKKQGTEFLSRANGLWID